MLGLGLLAGVSVAVAATLDNDGLGPGAGPWGVGTPEEHGLSSKELDAASKLAADRVPDRYCILVVKDGLIMSESYFNNQTVDGRYGWFAPEQRSIHFFHFYYSLFQRKVNGKKELCRALLTCKPPAISRIIHTRWL